MSNLHPLLAQMDDEQALAPWRNMGMELRAGLIIFGALFLVTLGVLIWAVFFRTNQRHRSRRHSHDAHTDSDDSAETASSSEPKKRRRWHRRREHRPRNPTLAETGGLPPIRPEEPREPQP